MDASRLQRTVRAGVLPLGLVVRFAEREMLGSANQLRAGGANVDVSVDKVGEIVDAEEARVVALPLLVQGGHNASGFAFPQRGLGAVAAVADELARRSSQVHLVLVEHPADGACIRVTSSAHVNRGDDVGLAAVNDYLGLIDQSRAPVVPRGELCVRVSRAHQRGAQPRRCLKWPRLRSSATLFSRWVGDCCRLLYSATGLYELHPFPP